MCYACEFFFIIFVVVHTLVVTQEGREGRNGQRRPLIDTLIILFTSSTHHPSFTSYTFFTHSSPSTTSTSTSHPLYSSSTRLQAIHVFIFTPRHILQLLKTHPHLYRLVISQRGSSSLPHITHALHPPPTHPLHLYHHQSLTLTSLSLTHGKQNTYTSSMSLFLLFLYVHVFFFRTGAK